MSSKNSWIFPSFKVLTQTDIDILQSYYPNTSGYSDFNLMSIWGYMNTHCLWSILCDTLVYQFRDYLTNSSFITFASENLTVNTIDQIFDFVKSNNKSFVQVIKLIPGSTIAQISEADIKRYQFELDRDNFDYILDIGKTASAVGSQYESKRHEYNRFIKKNVDYEVLEHSTLSEDLLANLINLFKTWAAEKKSTEWQHEFNSLLRAITNESFTFTVFTLKVGAAFAGFAVIEPISPSTVMLHYWKTSSLYTNAYGFLMIEICRILSNRGYTLLNFQQDIGLLHLRESKLRWHPVEFLKKYKVDLSKS